MISHEELAGRVAKLRDAMRAQQLDAVVVYSDEYRSGHTTYLTDYKPINVIEESPQVVLLVEGLPPVVLIGRLNSYAAKAKTWIEDVRPIHRASEDLPELFRALRGRSSSRIGLIGTNLMPVDFFNLLRESAPRATFSTEDRLIVELRQIKSAAEIDLMRRTAEITDEALRHVLRRIKVGQTEMTVAGEAEFMVRQLGGDFGSATVIMSGPNTEFPAWRPSRRVLEPGDFVVVDFSASYEHYCNDGAITILLPGATPEQVRALTTAHRVLKEVVQQLRPHTKANTVHRRMLESLRAEGYEDSFVPYARGLRGVGHGVGLDVVEPPNLGPNEEFLLQPGMTLAIKLDLHGLPGGGLRAEAVVTFTENGVRPLNQLLLAEPDDFAVLR